MSARSPLPNSPRDGSKVRAEADGLLDGIDRRCVVNLQGRARWVEARGDALPAMFELVDAVHPNDRANARALVDRLRAETKALAPVALRLRDEEGCTARSWRWMWFREEERLQGGAARYTARDVELAELMPLLYPKPTLHRTRPGLWCWDNAEGRVGWSPQACALHGHGERSASVALDDAMAHYPEAQRASIREALEGLGAQASWRVDTPLEGTSRWLRLVGRVVLSDGEVVGYRGLVRDITAELEPLKAASEDTTAAIVAHELRTPLTAVHGALRLILNAPDGLDAERADALVRLAERNCTRMVDLVEDVLEMGRYSGTPSRLALAPLNVAEVWQATADQLHWSWPDRVLIVHQPQTMPLVLGHYASLCRVFVNLLNNAFRHAPADQPVRVHLTHEVDTARLRCDVIDRGPGVPEAERARIFEPFVRIERANTQRGNGLGLAIVKAILDKHHAEVCVLETEGGGATFRVELPVV